jgi:hypothetical protein
MITAKQAAAKAKNYTSGNLSLLHTQIEKAASAGKHNLITSTKLSAYDIKEIEAHGYTIVADCDDRPCASPSYNISW